MSDAPLRTLIVDDEPVARNRLRRLCEELGGIEVVETAGDGVEAIDKIRALSPDLVLLDIAMPGLDGMGVAGALARTQRPPAVVFCTAYDRHALAAFDVSAIDYLLKPIARERLAQAVEKVRRFVGALAVRATDTPERLDHVWAPHRGAMLRIEVADIHRIEAERDYVRLWTAMGSYLVHETMAAIEGRLDPELFLRLRRSLIVRISSIEAIRHDGLGAWTARLAGANEVRIGPTYLKQAKARLHI